VHQVPTQTAPVEHSDAPKSVTPIVPPLSSVTPAWKQEARQETKPPEPKPQEAKAPETKTDAPESKE
jgi:hypothetical protein